MSSVYRLENGRTATDCPLCGQAVRIDRSGKGFRVRCYGGCTDSEVASVLDPAVLLELAGTSGDVPTADWLTGQGMDPIAVSADPLPTVPGFPYLHPGTAAVISGPTGAGRSSLVQAGAYDAAREGARSAYLGSEVTSPEFNARAADLAARRCHDVDEDLRERLALVRYLTLASVIAEAWRHPTDWTAAIAELYEVVLIDPLSAVASALDLDFDKSNADFVRFYDKLIQPIVDAGVAVVMLENIGHAAEARNRAKGASAKQDRADLTFSCSLQANPVGLLIRARKVRTVRAAFQRGDRWVFDRETQTIARDASNDAGEDWRPTQLMERVSRALEREPDLTRNEIRRTVGGKAGYVDQALRFLIEDGHVTVRQDGKAHRHHVENRYRVPEFPTGPDRVPDPVQPTGSLSPTPRRGDSVPDPVATSNGHAASSPTDDELAAFAEAERERLREKGLA